MIEHVSSIVERLALIQRELVGLTDAYSGTGVGGYAADACRDAMAHVHRARETLHAALKPPGVTTRMEPETCPHCGFTKGSAACQRLHP